MVWGGDCVPETDYRLSLSRRNGTPITFEPEILNQVILIQNSPTPSIVLQGNWRQRCETYLRALINSPEMPIKAGGLAV